MARTEIAAEASLDTTKFQRGLAKADKGVKKFAKTSVASVGRIASAFAGVALVKSVIGLGTAAAETASKFDAVFGPAAEMMNEQVEKLKQTIPATTKEMQDALATFGQMARSFGLNSEAANMFSVEMVRMAGDLASFHNMRPEDVFIKLRAAISGEFEPLKQLGIVINQATLEQEALNQGIWDGVGAMSAAQKALTTQSLLVKQMGTAQGDAAATADSAANQIKFLQTQLKDMGAEIGQTVLPAVVQLVDWMGKAAKAAKSSSEAVGSFIGKTAFGSGKSDPLGGYLEAAEQELERKGAFDSFGKGPAAMSARGAMIKKRAAELKASVEARAALSKQEEDIEKKITEEITDPSRVQAQEKYNESLHETIKAAGQLSGIEKGKSTAGQSGAKLDEGKMGLDIERGEFESRRAFLSRRESARKANIRLQEAKRQIAAGSEGFDMGTLQQLKQTAMGGGTDSHAATMENLTKSMEHSLKTIERELS